MEKTEFIKELDKHPDLEWREEEHEGDPGIMVANHRFETVTHFSYRKGVIEKNDWKALENFTYQGKNVEHMTRVTGYFSKVGGWNKGKQGELKDRHKNQM
jgi:hypothetical protein